MISKVKYEYLLFFIAAAWTLLFAFVLQLSPYFDLRGDDTTYLQAAQLLYNEGLPDNTRPMLVAAIFGLPFAFGLDTGWVLNWVFMLNFTSWFLTGILVFKIGAAQFNRKTGFVLGLLYLLCIGNLAHAFRFLSEPVFILMLMLAIYLVHRFFLTQKSQYLTVAICVLLFAALVKPVAIGLALLTFLFFVKRVKAMFWNRFAILPALALASLFVQMYAVKKTYGDFTLSYISSITYYNYLGAKADCYRKNIEYLPGKPPRTVAFNQLDGHQMKQVAAQDLAEQLQNNKSNLARAYLFCIYSNSSKGNYIVSECKNSDETFYFDFFRFCFKALSKLQNVLFTIFGVLLSLYFVARFKTEQPFFVWTAVFLLYIFFISAISCFECDRFHIAFFPVVLLQLARIHQKRLTR